jgi:hypothetical protein
MRESPDQIVHIYRIPLWGRALNIFILSIFGYALLTRSDRLFALWEKGVLGKLMMILGFGFLIITTYETYCHRAIITTEKIYLRNWRGNREISYRDVSEVYAYATGSLIFLLKGKGRSKKIATWVPPPKLKSVTDAVTLAGGRVIRTN